VNVGLADRTLLPVPVDVVVPVPPLATASNPAIVKVPADVIGPPENTRPVVPPDTLIDDTEPTEDQVGVVPVPPEVRTWPAVPTLPLSRSGTAAPARFSEVVAPKVVNDPAAAAVPPIGVLLIEPPDIVAPPIVGFVDKTTDPDPVEVETPVPPFATGRIPDTCVVSPTLPKDGAVPTP